MCRGGAAPGVDEELQVLLAAWLPLGDRLLRRLLALLGGLVTRVQLHRSACAHARALRVHCALAGWWGVGWRSMRRWGRWTTGRRECWPRCSSCRLGRAVPCECASVCAAALTSHLVLNERLSRLLLRSRRSRWQHLHSRARDAARLTRLRRQRRQKACADGDQHRAGQHPAQHPHSRGTGEMRGRQRVPRANASSN